MEWYLIGIIAALLTSFGFVPQIIKMHRTKSVKDVSLTTLLQFSAGAILWILYGIHHKDTIIIAANTITFVTVVCAVAMYYHFKRK
jgi:MtN3 and saliva related transmembrane protein